MITQDERDLLEELRDCQGEIDNRNYTPKQRRILKELENKGLVALRWVIKPAGKQEIT